MADFSEKVDFEQDFVPTVLDGTGIEVSESQRKLTGSALLNALIIDSNPRYLKSFIPRLQTMLFTVFNMSYEEQKSLFLNDTVSQPGVIQLHDLLFIKLSLAAKSAGYSMNPVTEMEGAYELKRKDIASDDIAIESERFLQSEANKNRIFFDSATEGDDEDDEPSFFFECLHNGREITLCMFDGFLHTPMIND